MPIVDRSLWVEDRYALRCRGCNARFTMFRRRHHCRLCGQVFCSTCLCQPVAQDAQPPLTTSFGFFAMYPAGFSAAEKICQRCTTAVAERQRTQSESSTSHLGLSLFAVTPQDREANPEDSPLSKINEARQLSSKTATESAHAVEYPLNDESLREGGGRMPGGEATERKQDAWRKNTAHIQVPFHHCETEEERSIEYSLASLPRVRESSLFKWLEGHLKKTRAPVSFRHDSSGTAPASELQRPSGSSGTDVSPMEFGAADSQHPQHPSCISFGSPPYFTLAGDHPLSREAARAIEGEFNGSTPFLRPAGSRLASSPVVDQRSTSMCRSLSRSLVVHWLARMLASPHFTQGANSLAELKPVEGTRAGKGKGMVAQELVSWTTALLQATYMVTTQVLRDTEVALGSHILNHINILCVTCGGKTHPKGRAQGGTICLDVIAGLAFQRSLTTKRMPAHWENPRILLLEGNVTYMVQSSSFLEYVDSYKGHLDKLFHRIQVWAPQVIVVEEGMHHYLQQRIADTGEISLVLNVGRQLLKKLAYCCRATVVADLQYITVSDLRAAQSPLGTCGIFRALEVDNESGGWLCIFEQLPAPVFSTVVVTLPAETPLRMTQDHQRAWIQESITTAYHMALQDCVMQDLGMVEQATQEEDALFEEGGGGVTLSPPKVSFLVSPPQRAAVLTQNYGLRFGSEVVAAVAQDEARGRGICNRRLCDVICIQTIDLERLCTELPFVPTASGPRGKPEASMPYGAPRNLTSPVVDDTVGSTNQSAARKLEVRRFYRGDCDETLLSFLSRSASEKKRVRLLMCHGQRQIWVTKRMLPALGARRANVVDAEQEALQVFVDAQNRLLQLERVEYETLPSSGPAKCPVTSFLAKPPRCYVECPCCPGEAEPGDGAHFLTPHALNFSVSSFLELLFYAHTSLQHARCGEALQGVFTICFVCYPAVVSALSSPSPVLIRLEVRPLGVYRLHPPRPLLRESAAAEESGKTAAIRLKPQQEDVYLRFETESLTSELISLRSLLLDVGKDNAAMPSSQNSTTLAIFARCTPPLCTDGRVASVEMPSPQGVEGGAPQCQLLETRVAEFIEVVVPQLRRVSDVTMLRWNHLRSLMQEIKEWQRQRMVVGCFHGQRTAESNSEARKDVPGGKLPGGDRESTLWRLSMPDRQPVWLDEPTSILAVALSRLYSDTSAAAHLLSDVSAERRTPADAERNDPPFLATHYLSNSTTRSGTPILKSAETTESVANVGQPTSAMSSSGDSPGTCAASALDTLIRVPQTAEEALGVLREASKQHCGVGAVPKQDASVWQKQRITLSNLLSPLDEPSCSATVDVFFPAAFAALQYLFLDGTPLVLLQSLARCHARELQGGKTQAQFYCTLDGCLLLKELKWMELKHFVSFWGMEYFAHVAASYEQHNFGGDKIESNRFSPPFYASDVLFAKVFGLFAIQITGTQVSTDRSTDVSLESRYFMLMENLTRHREMHVDVAFDLKGSQRNRTAPSGSNVKLDTDLVQQLSSGSFLFCATPQKQRFLESLRRDTQLLCDYGIMDYSLFAAVDISTRDVQLGLIDFMHPYTGIKRLESKVKSGLDTVLGHSGRDPTIIEPVSYRERFMRWMDIYFCDSPDKLFPLFVENLFEEVPVGRAQGTNSS